MHCLSGTCPWFLVTVVPVRAVWLPNKQGPGVWYQVPAGGRDRCFIQHEFLTLASYQFS